METEAFLRLKDGRHLQVALDVPDRQLATKIAMVAGKLKVSVVEAGTPLIKRYGTKIIKELKNSAKESLILADMKSADVGDLEVRLAGEAGADIVTVLGCASNDTIQAAKEEAEKTGMLLEVDLINTEDPLQRMHELQKLGIKAFSFHVPIDVQKRRSTSAELLLDRLKMLGKSESVISVAGGLNPDKIKAFKGTNVNVFVVGSYLTSSVEYAERINSVLNVIKEL
ncbi:MAG: orotidine 5'-phosphate decarboxylase / HUMPS family protein [Nitrososphaeria archaeon]|nr:orotidine 5'-phosphate decarboxylase / HUMPS family protein [Conexivisphaerales archaeon]